MKVTLDLERIATIRAAKGWDAPSAENIDRKLLMAVSEICEAQGELRDGWEITSLHLSAQTGFWCKAHHSVSCEECGRKSASRGPQPITSKPMIPEEWERYELSKPEGIGIEIADAIMRLADIAYATGIDLQKCIDIKMEFNAQRPMLHGGRKF